LSMEKIVAIDAVENVIQGLQDEIREQPFLRVASRESRIEC